MKDLIHKKSHAGWLLLLQSNFAQSSDILVMWSLAAVAVVKMASSCYDRVGYNYLLFFILLIEKWKMPRGKIEKVS